MVMIVVTTVNFDVPALMGLTAPGRGRIVARIAALSRLRRPRIGRRRFGGIRPITPPPTLGDSVGFATPIVGGSRRIHSSRRVGDRRRLARAGITVSVTSIGNGSRLGNGSVTRLGRIVAGTPRTRRGACAVMRRVPRFPNNSERLLSFVTGGLRCPAVTRRGKVRNGIFIHFIISTANSMGSIGIVHSLSPCYSGRTVEIVRSLPG